MIKVKFIVISYMRTDQDACKVNWSVGRSSSRLPPPSLNSLISRSIAEWYWPVLLSGLSPERHGDGPLGGGGGSSSNTNLNSSSPSSQPGAAPIPPERWGYEGRDREKKENVSCGRICFLSKPCSRYVFLLPLTAFGLLRVLIIKHELYFLRGCSCDNSSFS